MWDLANPQYGRQFFTQFFYPKFSPEKVHGLWIEIEKTGMEK